MSKLLYREMITLQDLLRRAENWRLAPEEWHEMMVALDELRSVLDHPDGDGIEEVMEQFESLDPGTRAPMTSITDPRHETAPEPVQARIVDTVPRIAACIEHIKRTGGRPDTEQTDRNVH